MEATTLSKHAVEDNPIGLDAMVVEQLIPEIDAHVASLFVLFHQYQKHHWLVEGPQFRDLHLYLEESYNEIHQDLDALAERITVLGGIPTSSPTKLAERAYLTHEEEGESTVREMLNADLAGEQIIINKLREGIRQAITSGDFGTEKLLKEVLLHAEDRAHHLDHYLKKNSLANWS